MKKVLIILIISHLCLMGETTSTSIYFTGNSQGVMTPCGCSVPTGGLARKYYYLEQISPPDFLMDAGNTFLPILDSEHHDHQLYADKAELTGKIFQNMGYDAINLGEYDLCYSYDFILDIAKRHELPFISCNVIDKSQHLVTAPYKILTSNSLTLAVTGFCSPHQSGDYSVLDPASALNGILPEILAQDPDYLICLADMDVLEIPGLMKTVKGLDFYVCSRRSGANEIPMKVNKVSFAQLGGLGRNIGQLIIVSSEEKSEWEDLSSFAKRSAFAEERLQEYNDPQWRKNTSMTLDLIISNRNKYINFINRYAELKANHENYLLWNYQPMDPAIKDDPLIKAQVIKLENYPE